MNDTQTYSNITFTRATCSYGYSTQSKSCKCGATSGTCYKCNEPSCSVDPCNESCCPSTNSSTPIYKNFGLTKCCCPTGASAQGECDCCSGLQ